MKWLDQKRTGNELLPAWPVAKIEGARYNDIDNIQTYSFGIPYIEQ